MNPSLELAIMLLGGRRLGTFDQCRAWWQLGNLRLEVSPPRPLTDGATEIRLYSIYTCKTAYIRSDDPQKLVEDELLRILT